MLLLIFCDSNTYIYILTLKACDFHPDLVRNENQYVLLRIDVNTIAGL